MLSSVSRGASSTLLSSRASLLPRTFSSALPRLSGFGSEGFGKQFAERMPRFQLQNNIIVSRPQWDQLTLSERALINYEETPSVKNRPEEEIDAWRAEHEIKIVGTACRPILNYDEAPFPPRLMDTIKHLGFEKPTPIQSQGWPTALSDVDMVGISQTGSGKTQGFILPGIMHALAQPPIKSDGPIMLVLAPTRELSLQIETEAKKFLRPMGMRSACLYGGAPRPPQISAVRRGVHLVVATPGRLADFLNQGVINLHRASYVVLDEADRMLDMGFEDQIRSILGATRPDRQTLMWSATWPKEIRNLAEDYLRPKYARVSIGNTELSANPDVTQVVDVVSGIREKGSRVVTILNKFKEQAGRGGKFLIFCSTKRTVDQVVADLQAERFYSAGMHGDKTQSYRDETMAEFRRVPEAILVATDVAARGLDVTDIDVVVNYDLPNNIEDYVHRIGRTGRAGRKGTAVTMVTDRDNPSILRRLVQFLQQSNVEPPAALLAVAGTREPGRGGFGSGGRGGGGGGFGGGGGGRRGGGGRGGFGGGEW